MRKKNWILLAASALCIFSIPYLVSIPPLKRVVIWVAQKKTGANLRIDSLRLSWLGPQKMSRAHVQTAQIDGEITEFVSDVPFWRINSMSRSIEKIDASGTTNIDGQLGKFSIQGSLASSNAFNLRFSMRRMPTAAIDQFFAKKGLIASALGPAFDASGSALQNHGTGEVDLDLSSPNATASVRASFTPDGLTLRKPLAFSILLTPELTKALTQGALSVKSIDPAQLQIEPEGFFLPRSQPLIGLKIFQGFLDLGRIQLQNASFLTPLSTFLKAQTSSEKTDVWLTSADFRYREGILTLQRVDALLAKSLHVCAWGKADFSREQLDMIFGIPADTLSKSLGVKNISANYVLQIPVTGDFRAPQFDTNSAAAKIAALIAAGQVQKRGGILGGTVGIITRVAEEKAPPPKRPFPWQR